MAAVSAAVLAAISLGVIDIYVTGHGGQSLMRPWISWGSWVELSRGDALFYLVALTAGGATFLLAREHSEQTET